MPLPAVPRTEGPHVAAPPSERRRPTALLVGVLAALLLVVAVVTGISLLDDPGEGSAAATTTTAERTTAAVQTPATVQLDPAAYLGRPVAEVQAELAALGLAVTLQPVQTADVADGLVTALGPTGGLVAGSTVTVSHAVAPPAAPVDEDEDDGDGNGNGDEGNGDEGNGNGNGNGNDKDKKGDRD
jgi:serine/threonine-protein kinase